MDQRSIKRANRLQAIKANPLGNKLNLDAELVQIKREIQAQSHGEIAKAIRDLAQLAQLTTYEQRKLAFCEALMASARASRRHYEADIHDATMGQHFVPCGPARAFQGYEHYEVLRARHDSSVYQAVIHEGYHSHTEAVSGPARVDSISDIAPTKDLPTDCLAQRIVGRTARSKQSAKAIDATLRRTGFKRKRGKRNRGKGGKGTQCVKHTDTKCAD